MKVLIVGGAGYIGGYLTDVLSKKFDITVLDNLMYEDKFLKNVNFIFGDIRNTKLLKKIINKFDIIIWLAAIVGDGACSINKKLTYKINRDTVKWLCNNYKKGKIVFASTCSVYGKNEQIINKDTIPNPLSDYAKSKLQAEFFIKKRNNNYLIIRLGTLFGIGDKFSRLRLDLVANILTTRSANNQELTVFGGDQWRPMLHVKDVANAISFFLKKNSVGTFNLAYKNFRIFDIAKEIKKLNKSTKVKKVEQKFEDQRNYRIDLKTLQKTGWKNKFLLSDGIKEIFNAIKEKRVKDTENINYYNHKYLETKI